MAAYLTELDITVVTDNLYRLEKSLTYESDLIGLVTVPPGFYTDLASVPRVPFIYTLWGGRAHHEAVIHDYLFRRDSVPLVTHSQANSVFLEAMTARGKSALVKYPMYWGVCIGSGPLFHKRKVFWLPGDET